MENISCFYFERSWGDCKNVLRWEADSNSISIETLTRWTKKVAEDQRQAGLILFSIGWTVMNAPAIRLRVEAYLRLRGKYVRQCACIWDSWKPSFSLGESLGRVSLGDLKDCPWTLVCKGSKRDRAGDFYGELPMEDRWHSGSTPPIYLPMRTPGGVRGFVPQTRDWQGTGIRNWRNPHGHHRKTRITSRLFEWYTSRCHYPIL